jgi:hypothetical protein
MDLEIVSAMMTPESGADIFTDHPVEIQLIWTKVDLGPEEGPDVAVLDEWGLWRRP